MEQFKTPSKVLEEITDFALNRQCACKACGMARTYQFQVQQSKVEALRQELRKQIHLKEMDAKIVEGLKENGSKYKPLPETK